MTRSRSVTTSHLSKPAPGFRFRILAEVDPPPTLDTTVLEAELDAIAREVYIGRYARAHQHLDRAVANWPFVERLKPTIPSGESLLPQPLHIGGEAFAAVNRTARL